MIPFKVGRTSVTIPVFIQDSASTTGAGKTGLTHSTSGWKAYYIKPGAAPVAIALATQTPTGAWTSGGFCEIDATNTPGWYRLDLPNAALSTNSGDVVGVSLCGATGAAPCNVGLQIVAYDPANSANLGLSNLATYTLTNIIDRLPAALVGGRMDSSIGAYASGQDPATLLLTTPANKLATDSSGRVTVGAMAAAAVASIWDALTSGITTAGSIGKLLVDNINATISSRSTLTAANVWDALTSGFATTGSVGKRIVDYLTGDAFARLGTPAGASVSADIAAVKTDTAAIKAKTDNLPASPAAVGSAMTLAADAITAAALASDAVAEIADGVWDEATSGHTATGTYGGRIVRATNSNVEVQITGSNHITADVHAFQAGVIDAAAIATGAIDADALASDAIAEIQAGTSLVDLATMITGDGTVGAKFTTTALSNAPSGGGGGGGGTIVIERQIRLSMGTASPIAEPFAFMEDDAYTLKAYITDSNGDPVSLTGYTLTASATTTLGVEIDAPTVTAHDEALGIVDIAITTDLTAAALVKGYLSVKLTDGTNTYITVPTEISVGAR